MGNWTFIDNNGYQWIWDGERVYLPEAENVENNGYPAESPNEAIQALINGGYIEPDYLDKEAVMDKQAILDWLDKELYYSDDWLYDGGRERFVRFLTAHEGECVWCCPPEWRECPFCGKKSDEEGE